MFYLFFLCKKKCFDGLNNICPKLKNFQLWSLVFVSIDEVATPHYCCYYLEFIKIKLLFIPSFRKSRNRFFIWIPFTGRFYHRYSIYHFVDRLIAHFFEIMNQSDNAYDTSSRLNRTILIFIGKKVKLLLKPFCLLFGLFLLVITVLFE